MLPALAQVCSLSWPLEQDLPDYAAGACSAVELWLGKVETFLAQRTAGELRGLLAEHRLTAPVASYQGGLFTAGEDYRREHWASLQRRLKLCQELGIETLIIAGDIAGPLDQQLLDRVSVSLLDAATLAGNSRIRLAFEFQGRAAFANNLQTAAALVAEVGSPHLGLCLDAFHYYVGPSKPEDLGYLTAENLFHVQLCDLAGQARELATDSDRVLPGDGDFLLEPIVARLKEIGYARHVSVEVMNPQIWQVPPRQFGEIAMTALRKTLGQASMG